MMTAKERRGLMVFDELHSRYGTHVAKRVQQELSASEFEQLELEELPLYLETRAEFAHKEYQSRLENPFINEELGHARGDYVDVLYKRWKEAEELAYLVSITEDVGMHLTAAAK